MKNVNPKTSRLTITLLGAVLILFGSYLVHRGVHPAMAMLVVLGIGFLCYVVDVLTGGS